MQYKIHIALLKQEIPAIEENIEGCLKGGFLPISLGSSTQYYNFNCPSGSSSCSATVPSDIFFENVNCPQSKEATCSGSTSKGCANLNCSDGSCSGTTTASPTSDPTNANANINSLTFSLF